MPIQNITVRTISGLAEDLLEGKGIVMPQALQSTFKQAAKHQGEITQMSLLQR